MVLVRLLTRVRGSVTTTYAYKQWSGELESVTYSPRRQQYRGGLYL
jgi:hypothetical protein